MTKQTNSNDADVAFIKALAEILNDNDLTELSVKREYGDDDSLNVRVSRRNEVITQVQAAAPAPSVPAPTVPDSALPVVAPADSPAEDPAAHPGAVASPMVGTVYLQAEPGAPSFISIGAQVSEGDTLLIVEAMKTMNHIPAPRAGTVKRILVADGDPVEYGTPLAIIE